MIDLILYAMISPRWLYTGIVVLIIMLIMLYFMEAGGRDGPK